MIASDWSIKQCKSVKPLPSKNMKTIEEFKIWLQQENNKRATVS